MFKNLFGKKQTIRITMIDVDSGELIDIADVPPDQLPEEFIPGGKVEGKGKSFTVIEVNPRHAKEYLKTGEVKMELKNAAAKVDHVNPEDVMMTLPTIAETLPPTGTDPFSQEGYFNMHEDDWRQIEFVDRKQLLQVEEEFAAIRDIFENHMVKFEVASFGGFKKLHLRNRVPAPVAIPWEELKGLVNAKAGSLTFSTSAGKPYGFVTNGFSFRVGEGVLYGYLVNGNVVALGVREPEEMKTLCGAIKNRYDLLLVDWVRTEFL